MLNQITIHQLDLFLVAAKLRNFSRAAEQMSISQPAFSAQIIKLEKILGSPLFERIGRRIELTEAGSVFEAYTQASLNSLREGKQAIDDITKNVVGKLRLGASTTIANYILPFRLGGFKKKYPLAGIEMMVGNTSQIEQALLRGEIDLGLVEGPVRNKSISVHLFMKDELVVIYPYAHRWKGRSSISLDEFKKEPLIIRERGSGTRRVFTDVIDPEKNHLNIVMEIGDTEAIKKSARAGLGVAVMSRAAVEEEIKAKTLRATRIEGVGMERSLNLIILKNRYLSNPLRAFVETLEMKDKLSGLNPG